MNEHSFQNLLDAASHLCYRVMLKVIVNAYLYFVSSCFPSTRINLSPFTKDFRGGEQVNESVDQYFVTLPCGGAGHELKE